MVKLYSRGIVQGRRGLRRIVGEQIIRLQLVLILGLLRILEELPLVCILNVLVVALDEVLAGNVGISRQIWPVVSAALLGIELKVSRLNYCIILLYDLILILIFYYSHWVIESLSIAFADFMLNQFGCFVGLALEDGHVSGVIGVHVLHVC